jgi:outer membrane protein assembly factor BamB
MKTLIYLFLSVSSALAQPIISINVDTLRFGMVSVGGCHQRDLRIGNAGDGALVINHINLPDSAFMLNLPQLPDTILLGERHSFLIEFKPLAEIIYNGSIIINSNDPATPAFSLPLLATGVRAFAPGDIIWSYQGNADVVSVTAINDVNNDGFPDVVAESYDNGISGNNLLCVSGSGQGGGQLIWSARPLGGPSNSGGYGDQCLITVGDLNGNGSQDIVLGTAWGSRSVFGIEGRSGQTIWSYSTYVHTPSGWIYSVASMGDLNHDGVPEILAGLGSDANMAFCLNGVDGSKLWKRSANDVVYSVCRLDDVDGDSTADAVLGTGDGDDRVFCLSGAPIDSGSILWTYHTGASVQSVDRISDLNADGFNDVIVGTWNVGDRILVLSGHPDSGAVTHPIWSVAVGEPVVRALACPDLNGDGREDVLAASWAHYALALSGADGHELWRNNVGDDVWAVRSTDDVTGDSVSEVIAGSFNGNVILINGSTGETIWSTHTDARILTIRPIADINGDSIPDIIAGQQMQNGIGGRVFLIAGGNRTGPDEIDTDELMAPNDYLALRNYPNPFNAETIISYDLPVATHVVLEIYNIMGQRLRVLLDEPQQAGAHNIIWNARDNEFNTVSSGVYFARLVAGDVKSTQKLVVLR